MWHIKRLEAEKERLQGQRQNIEVQIPSSSVDGGTEIQNAGSVAEVKSPSSSHPENDVEASDRSHSPSQQDSATVSAFFLWVILMMGGLSQKKCSLD